MGLFDDMKDKMAQREREEAERQIADKAAREEYKQRIMQSELVQRILVSLDIAKNEEENAWICSAVDYFDHDPREVFVEEDGDGITIQRVHYYDEFEVFQVPLSNGTLTEKRVKVHKCEIVSKLGYGFVKTGFKPIDTPRTVITSTGQKIPFKTADIRALVEEIVYGRLMQIFPQCDYRGRVVNQLGPEGKLRQSNDLTYFVPCRPYKDWY